jgi:hypothetical protein
MNSCVLIKKFEIMLLLEFAGTIMCVIDIPLRICSTAKEVNDSVGQIKKTKLIYSLN